ncbi:hypothetical protein SLA2020_250060 [Shorea laevis]
MGAFSFFFASFLLFISLNFHPGLCRKASDRGSDEVTSTGREAMEIINRGDGTSRAPSPEYTGDCHVLHLLRRPVLSLKTSYSKGTTTQSRDLQNELKKDPCGYTKTWTGKDICKYRGFTCEKLSDKTKLNALAAIDFNGPNFEGQDLRLDDSLEELNELAIFHANSDKFTGNIPLNVSNLQCLYELDLSNNMLNGDLPMVVFKAKNLPFLDLRFNNFKGVVPREAFNLDVDVLFINNNVFTQMLPDNVGNTTVLFLTFANNNFAGPIPSSIGKAKNLLEVLFLNNQLSGC